jgi:low affinity Fe/Cu permease
MTLGERVEDVVAGFSCNFRGFLAACAAIVVWALLGPHYAYSDTWQLIINTGTTIITFLMAFLIAANQRRADGVREQMLLLTERHVTTIDDHTDAWRQHSEETHALLKQVHTLTAEVHRMAGELAASHQSFAERMAAKFGWSE